MRATKKAMETPLRDTAVPMKPLMLSVPPPLPTVLPGGIIRPVPERGGFINFDNPDEPMYVSLLATAAREDDDVTVGCLIRLYDDIHPKYLVAALDIAAVRGHYNCVKKLLALVIEWGSYLSRSTALADSWNAGHQEVARALLEDGRFRARIIKENGDIEELTLNNMPTIELNTSKN